MNYNLKKFVSAATLLCSAMAMADGSKNSTTCSTCPSTCAAGQNTMQLHAFGASMSREVLTGKNAFTSSADDESWFGHFSVAGEYQRTGSKKCKEKANCCSSLGSLPFWSKDRSNGNLTYSNVMTAGDNSGKYDLDLYQVGMGAVTATTGDTLTLNPIVYQAGADFFLYVGAHKTERGFFLKAHAPIGVTSVDPRYSYTTTVAAANYPVGTLDLATNPVVNAPNADLGAAFMNPKAAGFLKAMNKGLICSKRTSSAKFGDPEFTLGYNVFADEKKHFGVGFRFAAPTGNKAEATYMLEPIFGRNGHWAAGGEIIGNWKCWESDTDDKYINIFLDGSAMHLFKSKHMRSFDLKANGAGSKYLLLGKYSGTTFQNEIVNAVNVTTLGVESSFGVEGNFALAFDFHWNNWSLALGYEGWGRSCEKLNVDCSCPGSVDFNDYAVLGRQGIVTTGQTTAYYCEPLATIGKSQAQLTAVTSPLPAGIADATVSKNRIATKVDDALDIQGQIARSVYTSKPFAQLQYTWKDSDYNPYLGVSGGAEFVHGKSKNSAAKFWHIGAQGGITF